MKILFLSHYFFPEGNAPATRVTALTRRWARAGHQVQVITGVPNVPSGVPYQGYENRLWQTENIAGVDVTRVWTYLAANQGTAKRIVNYLSFLATSTVAGLVTRRPDVVIATSPQFFCGWAGTLVAKLRQVPMVLEIRDIWPESIVTVGAMRKSTVTRGLEWLERKMYAAADRVVTVGDGYRDQLLARGVDANKIAVIPNGIDRETFDPIVPSTNFRRELGISDETFVCAYVGTIGMAAGLDVLLRAGELLESRGRRDILLLAVGDGAERCRLEAECQRLGVRQVRFTGRLEKSQIPLVLASVDACLVHLRRQPLFESVLPSKIFEAAAMERPIILGVRGYAEKLIREAGCGLAVEPENAEELVSAVLRLADNRPLGRELGCAGRKSLLARFDQDALATQYLQLLDAQLRLQHRGTQSLDAPVRSAGVA